MTELHYPEMGADRASIRDLVKVYHDITKNGVQGFRSLQPIQELAHLINSHFDTLQHSRHTIAMLGIEYAGRARFWITTPWHCHNRFAIEAG